MKGKLHGLDLFSGIGGISQALAPWVTTVTYCERERYAQSVLLSRMSKGEIDSAPIWDDVTTLRADILPRVDIISGGFPCQDLSVAGHGKGLGGSRSGLFFEIVRLARELRPSFVFLENVPAIRTRGLHTVVQELSEIGFDCRWTMLSASEVGAPHKRERWFLLAHTKCERFSTWPNEFAHGFDGGASNKSCDPSEAPPTLADTKDKHDGLSSRTEKKKPRFGSNGCNEFTADFWSVEPGMGRVVNGIQNRSHRIKCLGNGVVPLQVRTAFLNLLNLEGFA